MMLLPNEWMRWDEMVKKYPACWVFVQVTKGDATSFDEGIVRAVARDDEVEDAVKYCTEQGWDFAFRKVFAVLAGEMVASVGVPAVPKGGKTGNESDKMADSLERLTWEQMQEKYPDQWLGLVDVKYRNDDGISVESGIVKYTDKTHSELLNMAVRGEIIHRHTDPDGHLQFGMVGVL